MARPQQRRDSPWTPRAHTDSLGSAASPASSPGTAPRSPPSLPLPLPASDIERVLDLARWAPSGDNAQTWRFELTGPRSARIHTWDTREHCVYDLRGQASQLGFGALLETVAIAASRYGLRADIRRNPESPEPRPVFEVTLLPDPAVVRDPLADFIPVRATQRRAMWTRPLTSAQKAAMEAAAGPSFRVAWIEELTTRLRVARLLGLSAKLRLGLREAYETHRQMIEWGSRFSRDRVPAAALGLSPLSLRVTRWALESWDRVRLLNALPGGSLAPRLELDVVPGIACAAHLLLIAPEAPRGIDDYLAAGRAWQRLWLEATRQGLWMQPEMTPLIFATYVREGVEFTHAARARRLADGLAGRLGGLLGDAVARRSLVLARVGAGPAPTARSLRLPIERLLACDASVPERTPTPAPGQP